MRAERLNIFIYGANILFLVFALSVLIWLRQRFRADQDASVKRVCELFTRGVLGDPDNLNGPFAEWEQRARSAEGGQFIKQLLLAKRVKDDRGERELVVYPFAWSALHGKPSDNPELRRLPLIDKEGPYGYLYLALDGSTLQSVEIAIWTLGVLLALSLGVLTTRLWAQEKSLTRTTIELDEKRRQLIRLERLALAGQLTANIMHDLRKPVLNIRQELGELTETLGHFAGASKGLRALREQVELFFAILHDLSLERFVKSQDAESEYVDLPRIVEQACRLVRYEQEAVKVAIKSEPGLPLALAPPYRLIQVFSNLALNAFQAMRGKGELLIAMSRQGDEVEIQFADTGPGIPHTHLPHIFTPFYSTKNDGDGAGLGLYISRQIVEELGGEIHADSKDGMGAVFTVRLPAAAPGKK